MKAHETGEFQPPTSWAFVAIAINPCVETLVLKHVLRHVEGDLVIVLDNASIHKTKAVTASVDSQSRLCLQYLPPYAPELNPIERVWAYIKRNVLGNFCARTLPGLKIRLRAGWQRVRYIELPTRLLHAYLPS